MEKTLWVQYMDCLDRLYLNKNKKGAEDQNKKDEILKLKLKKELDGKII